MKQRWQNGVRIDIRKFFGIAGWMMLSLFPANASDLGCSYQTGLAVFDSTGVVATGEQNTRLYQGTDNYEIGVAPSNLQIQSGALQCADDDGTRHLCTGNSEYAVRINLGSFPEMPKALGGTQTLNDTADTLVDNKNTILIENLNGASTVSIGNSFLNEIYSLTVRNNADVKLVYDGINPFKIKTLTINSGTLYMEPGTYYVESFSMQAGTDLVVTGTGDGSGSVKLLVYNGFQINAATSYYNYNTAEGETAQHPEKLFIASYTGSITVQAGAYLAAYLYADQGDVWIGGGTKFVGGAAAENITFEDRVTYYYLSDRLLDNGSCSGSGTGGTAYGDFIDTAITSAALSTAYNASTDTGSATGDPTSTSLKFLRTKIAGKTIPLTGVYLNDAGASADYSNGGQDTDRAMWFAIPVLNDTTVTGECPAANPSQLQQIIDPSTGMQAVFTIRDNGSDDYSQTKNVIVPATASKNARIEYIVVDTSKLSADAQNCVLVSSTTGNLEGLGQCVNSEVQYVDAYGQTAYDRCAVSTTYGQPCQPANHGAGTGLFNSPLGCLMCTFYAGTSCSSDNFAIRPDYFSIGSTQTAFPNLLRAGEDYQMSVYAYDYGVTSGTDGTDNYNVASATTDFDLTTTKYFKNGTIADDTQMLGTAVWSVNDFSMTNGISWSAVFPGTTEVAGVQFDDVGKVKLRVIDPVWSAIDIDDTPQECTEGGTWICGDKEVTYIPYSFDFSELTLTNNNGKPGTFTYIANEVDEMAGRIETTIRALNKSGNVTQNFSADPLWENPVTVTPIVEVDAAKYLYPSANETTIETQTLEFGTGTDAKGTKIIPWNETNTDRDLRFNFQRDHDLPQNSFEVEGDEVKISLTSLYTDAADGDTATITGTRDGMTVPSEIADGGAQFVYGRVIPRDVRVFGNVAFDAYGWYEIYNTPKLTNVDGTERALFPSKNEPKWYINSLHEDNADSDGNAEVTIVSPTIPNTSMPVTSNMATPPNTGMETFGFNAVGASNIPYSGKAHIATDPWLWYGLNSADYLDPSSTNLDCLTHPCFNINVVPSVGATGSAQQDATSEKASKRTNQGTGWKSTSDYAPAVR